MIRTLQYRSTRPIDCGCLPQDILICVYPDLTNDTVEIVGYIEGQLTNVHLVNGRINQVNQPCLAPKEFCYTLQYDDSQLISYDEDTDIAEDPLVQDDIEGFMCQDCMFDYIRSVIPDPCPACPVCTELLDYTVTTVGNINAGQAVEAPNGFIYQPRSISSGSHGFYKFDPVLLTYSLVGTAVITATATAYRYCVLASNGFIYASPEAGSPIILKLDPATDTVTTIDFSALVALGISPWCTEVHEYNGFLYFLPGRSRYLVRLDLSDDSVAVFDITGSNAGAGRNIHETGFFNTVNDSLYMLPGNSTAFTTSLRKFDTSSAVVTTISSSFSGRMWRTSKWSEDLQRGIGFTPFISGSTGMEPHIEVNPAADTFVLQSPGIMPANPSWFTGHQIIEMPDGYWIMAPGESNANLMFRFHPSDVLGTLTVRYIPEKVGTAPRFFGAILHSNGSVYFLPGGPSSTAGNLVLVLTP